jgi:hypothetical protein
MKGDTSGPPLMRWSSQRKASCVVYVIAFSGFPLGIPRNSIDHLLVSLSMGVSGILSVRRAEITAPQYELHVLHFRLEEPMAFLRPYFQNAKLSMATWSGCFDLMLFPGILYLSVEAFSYKPS